MNEQHSGYTPSPDLEAYMILAQEIFRRVYADESAQDVHQWLLAQLQKLSGGDERARLTWEQSFDLYAEIMAKRSEQTALPEAQRRLLTWPWATWNKYLDPLDPGLLAVIAGADGSGKTLYAENLAEHWAKCGLKVVFIHFELNRALMLDRRMARHSGILRRDLKTGTLTPTQQAEQDRANAELRQWQGSITYVHTPGWPMERAMSEVSALVRDDLCDVFIIDYLEKAAASQRQIRTFGNNIFAREADSVEVVKALAESLERPAILLAQMNKAGKQQQFDNLDRTAIRGAGEKTEKANVVVLLHRESSESQIVQVRIDKNTMGACGSFEQYMHGARFMVRDMAGGL